MFRSHDILTKQYPRPPMALHSFPIELDDYSGRIPFRLVGIGAAVRNCSLRLGVA